jgi:hypothetical protein
MAQIPPALAQAAARKALPLGSHLAYIDVQTIAFMKFMFTSDLMDFFSEFS